MTNAHQQVQPCHHTTTGDEIDVVPGTPPVPITVWRTPSDEPGPHLGPRLAARLLAAYTSPGDTVYDTTDDPVLRQSATTTGRHYQAGGRSRAKVQPVALAVTAWPTTDDGRDLDPVVVYGGLRRRLRPGGILAVILATADGQPADAAGLVDVAAAAGLSYLQHIVAVHATATGDQLTPPDHPTAAPTPGAAAHIKVHRDLMIFTPAQMAPSSTVLKGGHNLA